jgi:uncharacterized GH25 family protein
MGFKVPSPDDKISRGLAGLVDGCFDLPEIPVGTYSLEIRVPARIPLRIDPVEIVAAEDHRIETLQAILGARLEGRVIDRETGKALAGVGVFKRQAGVFDMTAMMGEESPVATSAEDGTFEITGLPPGAIRLEATREGYTEASVDIDIPASQDLVSVTLELGPGGTLEGLVRTPEGQPSKGALVMAIRGMQFGLRLSARTDEQGRYRLENLTPGSYRVTVMPSREGENFDAAQAMSQMMMQMATIEEGEVTQLDFPAGMERGLTLSGRLLKQEEPVPGVMMFWVRKDAAADRALPISSTTDEMGRYDVQLPEPGVYVINASRQKDEAKGFSALSVVIEIDTADSEGETLDLVILDNGISGSVRSAETGEAIAKASVAAFTEEPDPRGGDTPRTTMRAVVMTGEDGTFEMGGLQPGSYRIVTAAANHALSISKPVEIDEDDEISGRDIVLESAPTLRVSVRSETGDSLSGFLVLPFDDPENLSLWFSAGAMSGVDGVAWLRSVPVGTIDLAIIGRDSAPLLLEDIAVEEKEGQALSATVALGASIRLRVVDAAGEGVGGVRVRLAGANGEDLGLIQRVLEMGGDRRSASQTDEEGELVIGPLRAGSYGLEATTDEGRKASGKARVGRGEDIEVTLTLR